MRIRIAIFLFFLASLASAQPTITVGQTFLTSGLDPAEGSAGWALVSHGVAEKLFSVNREGRVVPQLAQRLERNSATAWKISLQPGRKFSDGSPVNAVAVAAALNRNVEKNAAARATVGSIVFTAQDELTLTAVVERPTLAFDAVLAEWAFVVYRITDANAPQNIAFSGPYKPVDFKTGARLELQPNTHFPSPPKTSATIVRFADSQALALAFRGGELDLAFNLPSESLPSLQADATKSVKTFPVAYQYMLWQNTRRAPLQDERVRKAIALAIERTDLSRAIRAGQATASIWAAPSTFTGVAAGKANRERARQLLDEAGWKAGTNGMRSKDGSMLKLSLWAYPQRPDLVTMQPVLRAALAEVGIAVETRIAEQAQTLAKNAEFDLLLWAQHTAPSGDPAFFPALFLGSQSANNFAGFSDPAMDRLIARMQGAQLSSERTAIAKEMDSRIGDTAQVIFLVTPEWHVGLSRRIAAYEPWGSDYFIVRGDMGLR